MWWTNGLKFLSLFLSLVSQYTEGSVEYSLNGNSWILSGPNDILIKGVTVPGDVYSDLWHSGYITELHDNADDGTDPHITGYISDPYYRYNDVTSRWVSTYSWNYSRSFEVDDKLLSYNRVNLVLEGVDTVSTVWLNNEVIASTNNMFIRYVINIRKHLKTGMNELVVQFESPVLYAERGADNSSYDIPPDCPPDAQRGVCHFNFIRKQANSFSWDWGPAFPTSGIWKNISIEAYNSAVIRDVTVSTDFDSDSWKLVVGVKFDISSLTSVFIGSVEVSLHELNKTITKAVALSKDYTSVSVPIQFDKSAGVQAWWPNGYGDQKLYVMNVRFECCSDANNEDRDVDVRQMRVGFRTVELVQDFVESANPGYTFYFRINGVAVFAKGSNWIPADSFQSRITRQYIEKLLKAARVSNMNMLRVWGGGVYESEEFYELADELGIMIWQDFMLACSLYPTDSEFLENVKQEVSHQIRRLSRHPSIVLWAGNNENEAALIQNWFNVPSSSYERYYEDYVKLYVDVIREVVRKEGEDQGRGSQPYVTSSPSNGKQTETEGWVSKNPQSTRYGDIHFYDYSMDSWNWTSIPVPRFASEFGIQSWTSVESLSTVSLVSDLFIESQFALHRQHHTDGETQMWEELCKNLRPPPERENKTRTFSDYTYLTQINQAMGMRTEVEVYRRSQSSVNMAGDGLTMGALYWQLNDIWQAPTWASIEFGGRWKMLQYFARRFFSPQLFSSYLNITYNDEGQLVSDQFNIYYIDDSQSMSLEDESDNFAQSFVRSDVGLFSSILEHECLCRQDSGEPCSARCDREREKAAEIKRVTQLQIECYKWSDFSVQGSWTVKFNKLGVRSQSVYSAPVSEVLSKCQCASPAECFLVYFTPTTSDLHHDTAEDLTVTESRTAENFQLLASPLNIVGLKPATIKIQSARLLNDLTVEFKLTTDSIALFVWLSITSEYEGYFSDNGFLLYTKEKTLTFNSWDKKISDPQAFMSAVSVRSLSDVYT